MIGAIPAIDPIAASQAGIMRAYALMARVIENTELLGVFSTIEEANEAKSECEKKPWDCTLVIHEVIVGKIYEDGLN